MGLSLAMHQRLELHEELVMVLSQSLGEHSGDIPLFSLHRIKNLVKLKPIGISVELTKILVQELLNQNREYKEETGNDWNCLTGLNFTNAIENLDDNLSKVIDLAKAAIPKELKEQFEPNIRLMEQARAKHVEAIKAWFEEHYEDLLYITDGAIPWAVVRRLRKNLLVWSVGVINPFEENINEMVLEVANEQGIEISDPESAWVKMGGKLFKKKKEE